MELHFGLLSVLQTPGIDIDLERPLIISATDHAKFLTLGQVIQWTKALASGLKRQGLQPGDRVLVLSNMEESFIFDVVLFLGIVAARGIYCGLDMGNGPAEITKSIRSAEPRFIIANPSQWVDKITTSLERTGFSANDVFIVNDPFEEHYLTQSISVDGARWWNILFDHNAGASMMFPSVNDNDTVSLTWTSGTSGNKKAVELTHGNYLASVCVFAKDHCDWSEQTSARLGMERPQMRILSMYNIAHVSGSRLFRVIAAASKGHDIQYYQLAKGTACRAPQVVIELASRHRATHIWAPAGVCYRLSELAARTEPHMNLRHVDLSALTSMTVVGAPCPRSVFKTAHGFLGQLGADTRVLEIRNNWGMTETAGSIAHAQECATVQPDYHVGIMYPGMEVRISSSDNGLGKAADVRGEIEVRGPCLSKGYWRNPEATAEAFTPDGWFRTGDIGLLTPSKNSTGAACLQIMGRCKEMLKDIDGRQICLPQIESTLMEHPRVLQAAVVAIPDSKGQAGFEKPMAFVTGDITIEEAVKHIAREMSANCQLDGRVRILPVLPTTPDHKIDKLTLRQNAIRMLA